MKIADFFAAIGFDVDDKALTNLDTKLENVQKQTAIVTATLAAAVFAMDRFAASSIRGVVALSNFNVQTGLATSKLQKWQAAAQLSNMAVDAQTVTSSIQALQDNLTQIRLGQGNAAPFQLLGIDVQGQDAFSVLDQLRNRLKGLSPSLQSNMIQQMGIDPSLLNVLRLSNDEFERLGNNIINSKETNEAIMRIGNSINMLKLRFTSFKDELVAKLEPVFKTVISLLDRLGRAVDRIIGLFERFPAIGIAAAAGITALLVPLGALKALVSPLALALASLFLILEDIAVYFQGGKSVTGLALDGIKEGFNEFKEFLKSISDWIDQYIVIPIENGIKKITDLLPKEGLLTSLNNALPSLPSLPGLPDFGRNRTQNTNNAPVFNNNFMINGESNLEVARDVVRKMQEQLNYGLTDLNNGAAY